MKNQTLIYLTTTTLVALVLFLNLSCGNDDEDGPGIDDPGTISVNVTTDGVEIDTDGFSVVLDANITKQVVNNGSVSFDAVPVGLHTVRISELRLNCDPMQDVIQSITVQSGQTSTLNFDIECTTKPLVFSSNRGDGYDIYRMNLDGSGVVKVTTDGGWGPRWSPDGLKISYQGADNGLYIINEDGSGSTLIVEHAEPGTWSPDGQKLVTVKDNEIYTVNIDGTEISLLTSIGGTLNDPDWGPANDARIIFGYAKDGEDPGIFIMNNDGSNLTRLTTGNDFQPAWSKDGSKIAFSHDEGNGPGIYIMDFPGGNPERRTGPSELEVVPRWSPDDSQLTFTTILPGNQEVCIGLSTTAGALNLSQNLNDDFKPDWRPGN